MVYHSPSSGDCNSPPAQREARHAEGGGHATTAAAAPEQGAGARLTARAWPAAGGPPTLGLRASRGDHDMELRRAGGEAPHSHVTGVAEVG